MPSSSHKSHRQSGHSISPDSATVVIPPILEKAVEDLDGRELVELLRVLRDWMVQDKQPREVDYLRGRAARQIAQYGRLTPTRTDRDYQRDQPYETRLIDLLETMLRNAEETGNAR